MESPEQIRERLLAAFPGASVQLVSNPSSSGQHSLLLGLPSAREIATFLRDAPGFRFDYCSNVTGVDWPEKPAVAASAKPPAAATPSASAPGVTDAAPGPKPGPAAPVANEAAPPSGCLEVVYHLYSVELGHGPLILRMRTANRADAVTVPSLTPVWRSCEFQERQVFDLYGVVFEGHPDLRRILMWDEFEAHPMRRDYVAPDDFEWEPTPHDQVLARAKAHYPPEAEKAEGTKAEG